MLCFICIYIYDNYKVVNVTKLLIEETKNCDGSLDLYYTDNNKNNYYLYCLNKMTIDYGDRKLELNDALERKQIDINFVLNEAKKDSTIINYKDGGSLKYSNNNFSLLSCKTVDGNNDYYFGPSTMEYKEGFCKQVPYICSFIRTYLVVDITDSDDKDFTNITLKEFQKEEMVTIKIKSELASNIIKDSNYEFTFLSTGKSNKLDIKDLFESNKLLSINPTTKIGLDQINENICK